MMICRIITTIIFILYCVVVTAQSNVFNYYTGYNIDYVDSISKFNRHLVKKNNINNQRCKPEDVQLIYFINSNSKTVLKSFSYFPNVYAVKCDKKKLNDKFLNVVCSQKLKQIEFYNVKDINLSTLFDCASINSYIEVLLFINSTIDSIPKNICKLTQLKRLEFINCNIAHVPDEINLLPELERFVIKGNDKVDIPTLTFKKIKYLVLNSVNFDKIKYLTSLKYLSLADCHIDEFQSLCNMRQLKKLLIVHSNIDKFPYELVSHPNLIELFLCNNNISEISLDSSLIIHNLKLIDVGNNPITCLKNHTKVFVDTLSIPDELMR